MKKSYIHILVFLFPFLVASQQDGQVDSGFGNNGVLNIEFSEEEMLISSFAEQQDEKLLFSGNRFASHFLIRVNNDGSFDNTFADNGIATFVYAEEDFLNIQSTVVLPDGKILGFSNAEMTNELILFRFNANGSIDESFGVSGYLILPWVEGEAIKMFLKSDNKLLIVAKNQSNIYFLKLNEDLSLDLSYGNQGIANVNLSSFNISILDFVQQADGKIVFGASYISSGTNRALTARITENGQLDPSYGQNQNGISAGLELPDFGNIKIGKLSDFSYVLGYGSREIHNPEIQKSYLYKLTDQGLLNTSFGTDGRVEIGEFVLNNIIVQQNNRILVSGNILTEPTFFGQMHIKRYYSNGTLDNSFGNNGELFFSPEISHRFIKLQNDGKLLAFNSQLSMFFTRYFILRYSNNPLSIEDFDASTVLVYPNPSTGDFNLEIFPQFFEADFEVFDSLGRKILNGTFSNLSHTIDLSRYPVGMYYLITPFKTFKLIKK